MESIIIIKIIEVMISLSGAALGAYVMKKIKEKIYDNNGCNSGCMLHCETFINKTKSEIASRISNRNL